MEDLSFEDMEIVEQVLADVLPRLTLRQTQCLALLLAGLTQERAGRVLGLAQNTVAAHFKAVLGKVRKCSQQYR
jgi:DNA-binding NarL/FixJ family response regulator